jgi:hypothetical protein
MSDSKYPYRVYTNWKDGESLLVGAFDNFKDATKFVERHPGPENYQISYGGVVRGEVK